MGGGVMALELNGTTGVSLVQDGVVTAADLASGAITASALPSGTIVQYDRVELTGQRSWAHSVWDEWHHILEIGLTPKLTASTLYARMVLGGYENSNAVGRGHIKLIVNSTASGNSFAHNYGGTPSGTIIAQQMFAQDSSSTSGTISSTSNGTIANTDGSTKYFLFVGAQQDNGTGQFYVNRWNENWTSLEVWEVAP